MSTGPAILLIDANPSDRALSQLLLQRELPQASIHVIPDAVALSTALLSGAPDVAIVAADLPWADADAVIAALKERHPRTAIVLFGHGSDLMMRTVDRLLAYDALVQRTSAGFLRLPAVVGEALHRAGRRTGTPSTAIDDRGGAESPRGGNMQDIALVFSHDLQEPVQQIVRLARRAQGSEGHEPARTIRQVLACAERASSMLDGMTEYLTIAELGRPPAPVDLNACLTLALDNLRSIIDEAQADIRTVPLPMSFGDEHQIVHLFQNLISNAIKFRGRERPVIDIGVEPRGEQWLIAVRDNGIGIPRAFTERIFEFGKRLHTREEYPGMGVGLALCRRIVERHGGRIWSEPRDGGGSVFYVLLPGAPAGAASAAHQAVTR